MEDFSADFVEGLDRIDGAILKNRSPSCGTKDVRIYFDGENSPVVDKGPGVFGRILREKLVKKPIENEGRLRNHNLRENFYTTLFTVARFRKNVEEVKSMESMIKFHSRHKYILLSYDQAKLREMGHLVANQNNRDVEEIIELYGETLTAALKNEARIQANVNVLEHSFGYFSHHLSDNEKSLFLDYLSDYRAGKVPLSTIISMIRSWIQRFDQEYLEDQYYFTPYPSGLADISDSGKGVDL